MARAPRAPPSYIRHCIRGNNNIITNKVDPVYLAITLN